MNHKKELLWSLWLYLIRSTSPLWLRSQKAGKVSGSGPIVFRVSGIAFNGGDDCGFRAGAQRFKV